MTDYDEGVIEGVQIAYDQGVDLFALARSVAEGMVAARPPGPPDRLWAFPHESVRGLCAMEFIDAAGIEDRRLEEASARASRDAGMEELFQVGLEVLHERGFTPVVDALAELAFVSADEQRNPDMGTPDELSLYRMYLRDEITEGDLSNTRFKLDSLVLRAHRTTLLEVPLALTWLVRSEDGSSFVIVPEAEEAFRGWAGSGGALHPWEGRLTRVGRRRRRIARSILREWEATGRIRTDLPALIAIHPSRLTASPPHPDQSP